MDFLRSGCLGSFVLQPQMSPTEVLGFFGTPEQMYSSCDLDRSYLEDDPACYPLVISYGDVEFHFSAPNHLMTVFVDSFSAPGSLPDGGSLILQDSSLLQGGRPMSVFLAMAALVELQILGVRPHQPPYAMLVKTAAHVEIGFEHDDPDEPGSQAKLRWFCWDSAA